MRLSTEVPRKGLVLDPAAYHGVLGQIVRDIEPHSEADAAGILLQLLMAFGSTIGRRRFPCWRRHSPLQPLRGDGR
jgi:hypothetical protein